ncbi:MAG: hypothetical protein DMD40_03675 [Gemmatimonadetes bacterium]|nr:MAG: hypothetical protein DMD40_03675 [Gemmatimonadota bacterium]
MGARGTSADTRALEDLVAKRGDDIAAEALRTGGQVSPGRLEELARLARLVELRHAANTRSKNRWTLPAVALVTLIVASLLLFARVSTTEIEADLNVSEVSFALPTEQAITEPMIVAQLGVSGVRSAELPDARADPPTSRGAVNVLLAREQLGERLGSVTVDPITAPSGVRVLVGAEESGGRSRIILQGATPPLVASVRGPTRIVFSPVTNQVHDFLVPRRVTLALDSHQVTLDFTAADSARVRRPFSSPLLATGLLLSRVDQVQQEGQTLVRHISTIRSGTLYFEALDARAFPLRTGEGLQFAWSDGEIRELQLEGGSIALRFHGAVRGMSTGTGPAKRNLMPTWLDWLRARHGVWLLWGTTTYVVGLFLSISGWWKRTR